MTIEGVQTSFQGMEHRACQVSLVAAFSQFLDDFALPSDVAFAFGDVLVGLCEVPTLLVRHRPQSSSASRRTASHAGFLLLIQSGERPERYADALRFDTIPSRPILQAWATRSVRRPRCGR